jgi:xylan 1,4-beta-xylosidase
VAPIQNPILRGCNPDPSICRVGRDYYVATSTFEWYPGVQLHHSRDLAHWRLVGRPLSRASQLDLRGEPDSCGVWAPCLSHADGQFWLIYSDVKRFDGDFKDVHNYLVTAPAIEGPWSDPVRLNSSGFDPSLFHDADGRKWLVNMLWDHRAGRSRFGGILLQEYSAAERRLVGPVRNIFAGFYYPLVAEGGTGYEHASFTGNFLGMAAYDLTGKGLPADFDYFVYQDLCKGLAPLSMGNPLFPSAIRGGENPE